MSMIDYEAYKIVKDQRDELLEALGRLVRIASVELKDSRPDVIKDAQSTISKAKGQS